MSGTFARSSRLGLGWSSPPESDEPATPRAWAPSEIEISRGPTERGVQDDADPPDSRDAAGDTRGAEAARRALRLGSLEGPARVDRAAGGEGPGPAWHVAPAEAGPLARRRDPRRAARAAGGAGRLRGGARPARRPGSGRCLLLRAAEGLRLGRRLVDRAAQPGCAGEDRAAARVRSLDSGVPLAAHGARELGQGPDVQHARARHAVPARRAAALDARWRWARVVHRAHARLLRAPLRLGGVARPRPAVR